MVVSRRFAAREFVSRELGTSTVPHNVFLPRHPHAPRRQAPPPHGSGLFAEVTDAGGSSPTRTAGAAWRTVAAGRGWRSCARVSPARASGSWRSAG